MRECGSQEQPFLPPLPDGRRAPEAAILEVVDDDAGPPPGKASDDAPRRWNHPDEPPFEVPAALRDLTGENERGGESYGKIVPSE